MVNKESLALEWIQEESSEADDFILVEFRKKKRENRKNVKISPSFKGKRLAQESPGLSKPRGRKPMAKSSKNIKSKK